MIQGGPAQGAVESRVVNAGGRRGEGNGKCNPDTSRPWSSRWRRSGYGVSSSEKIRCSQARRTPFTHAAVEAGATRRESDARRRTDSWLSSFPQAVDAGAEQKWPIGNATQPGGPAGGYAGVPSMFQWHTCVSRRSSTREQENPEVRGGISIANQSGSIVSSNKSTTSSSSYLSPIDQARPQHLEETPGSPPRVSSIPEYWNIITVATPAIVAMDHREENLSGYSSPTTISRQASSSPTKSRHRRALLVANSIHRGNSLSAHSPLQPRLPQGLP
jgi:hypothetical protein